MAFSFENKTGTAPATLKTPTPQPGFFSRLGAGIKSMVTNPLQGGGALVNEAKTEAQDVKNKVSSAFQGGINQGASGLDEASAGISNPSLSGGLGQLAEGTGKLITGAGQALFSPLAPAMDKISGDIGNKVVNPISDAISNNPTVQNFANSPAGDVTSKIAGGIQLANNTVGTVLGGMGLAEGGGSQPPVPDSANPYMNQAPTNVWDKAYGTSATDPLASRTADATPSFNKNMQGQNIRTPEGDIVPRANEGEGLTGKRTVNTSASEAQQGKTLADIKDYPDNGTAMQKEQAVGKAISAEAENMRAGLQAEDKASPLDATAEKAKLKDVVESHLPPNIQDAIATGKGFPKTAEGTYWKQVIEDANKYNGTREGKLDFRQAIDSAYKNARGKLAFGSDSQNALDETNSSIRDAMNKDLADTTTNSDTQASLDKQTNLYRAKDTLVGKAKAEASSEIGRFFQNHPLLHRLATKEFLSGALKITGAAALTTYIAKTLQGK